MPPAPVTQYMEVWPLTPMHAALLGGGGCRGLEAVKRSERVYLEAYTSLLLVPKEKLVRHPERDALGRHVWEEGVAMDDGVGVGGAAGQAGGCSLGCSLRGAPACPLHLANTVPLSVPSRRLSMARRSSWLTERWWRWWVGPAMPTCTAVQCSAVTTCDEMGMLTHGVLVTQLDCWSPELFGRLLHLPALPALVPCRRRTASWRGLRRRTSHSWWWGTRLGEQCCATY